MFYWKQIENKAGNTEEKEEEEEEEEEEQEQEEEEEEEEEKEEEEEEDCLFVCTGFVVSFITSKCFLGDGATFTFKYDPSWGLPTSMDCLYRKNKLGSD